MRAKVAMVAVAIAAGPGAASAQAQALNLRVVAAPGAASAGYATPQTVVQKGKTASFLNLDIAAHDVISTRRDAFGRPLFRTPLIGIGARANIVGVDRLAVGAYDFFCSLHPNMKGKLRII